MKNLRSLFLSQTEVIVVPNNWEKNNLKDVPMSEAQKDHCKCNTCSLVHSWRLGVRGSRDNCDSSYAPITGTPSNISNNGNKNDKKPQQNHSASSMGVMTTRVRSVSQSAVPRSASAPSVIPNSSQVESSSAKWSINRDELEILEQVGEGSFGKVIGKWYCHGNGKL